MFATVLVLCHRIWFCLGTLIFWQPIDTYIFLYFCDVGIESNLLCAHFYATWCHCISQLCNAGYMILHASCMFFTVCACVYVCVHLLHWLPCQRDFHLLCNYVPFYILPVLNQCCPCCVTASATFPSFRVTWQYLCVFVKWSEKVIRISALLKPSPVNSRFVS